MWISVFLLSAVSASQCPSYDCTPSYTKQQCLSYSAIEGAGKYKMTPCYPEYYCPTTPIEENQSCEFKKPSVNYPGE